MLKLWMIAIKDREKTILIILREDNGGLFFDSGQWKSLEAMAIMVERNGAIVFRDLTSVAAHLNTKQD